MLQNIIQSKFHSTPETNSSVKNVIEYESPINPTKPATYNTIENFLKFSPNVTNNSENVCHTINSEESAITRDSLTKIKPFYKGLFNNKSIENGSIDNSNIQRDLQNTLTSPKHNKSVLKSTNVSTSSLIKKKVIFDLTNESDRESSSNDDIEKEELGASNWNSVRCVHSTQFRFNNINNVHKNLSIKLFKLFLYIISVHSTFGEKTYTSEPEEYKGSNSIVLKTTQSDKIAEISKKLEAQVRH